VITLALEEQGWGAGVVWPTLVEQALHAALAETTYADLADTKQEIEISVTLGDDANVHALNKQWRGKDAPTNVLSFPMTSPDELDELPEGAEAMLGDIILAQGVCSREATEKNITIADHATHLVVHGMLHLLGYDHMNEGEAEEMEAIEQRALARLGIADPYAIDGV
jgi:probable rRNA maturation factor